MRRCHVFIHTLLLVTSPSLFVYPHAEQPHQSPSYEIPYGSFNLTYDDVLHLLEDIESGKIEEYSEEKLESISQLLIFLAEQGMLPGEEAANAALVKDIAALNTEENFSDYSGDEGAMFMLCKNKHKHEHKHKHKHKHKKNFIAEVKDFVKKHKKAILIGAAILVAATVVVVAVTAASAATAATAASAAAAAAANSPRSSNSASDTPQLDNALEDQITSFKETLATEEHFNGDLPIEENLRTLGSLFAHHSSQEIQQQLTNLSPFYQETEDTRSHPSGLSPQFDHYDIDKPFSTDYASLYATPQSDFNTIAYQIRGERALDCGYYEQAVHDFGKAIEFNSANSYNYLERGVARFNLGQYELSLKDFEQYLAQKPAPKEPFSLSSFSLGFASGLPSGIYDSGEGTLLFLADLIHHPIYTSEQVWDSLIVLKDLVKTQAWETIAQTISPQVHDLVVNWDSLSSYERGELAGYAFGRHGTDFLLPAAAAKAAKTCQELVTLSKNLQLAEKTLLLESISNLGNEAKIAEVIQSNTAIVAEKLGFNAREIAQFKIAGQIEGALGNIAENIPNNTYDLKFTHHALQRAVERGVSRESIVDALSAPLKVEEIKIDNLGRPSQRIIGQKAEVVINPETQQIVSVNPTSTKKFEKLNNELNDAKDRAK